MSSSPAEDLAERINSILDSSENSTGNISSILREISLSSLPTDSDDEVLPDNGTFDDLDGSSSSAIITSTTENTPSTNYSINLSLNDHDVTMSYENSADYSTCDQQPEINSFLAAFNAKYDTNISNLLQALEQFDKILKQVETKTSKKKQLPDNTQIINDLRTKVNNLQKENEELKNELAIKNVKLSENDNKIIKQSQTQSKENENLQTALAQMQEIMEIQLSDIAALSAQRSSLIEITHKQNALIQKLDSSKAAKVVVVRPPPQQASPKIANDESELYSLMISMTLILDNGLPQPLTNKIISIRDNSSSPVRERILLIIQILSDIFETEKTKSNESQKELDLIKFEKDKYKNKCIELLNLFEEELSFLQNLSRSTDLQSTILYKDSSRTQQHFTDEQKRQLVHRCAQLNKFVEETLGNVSEDKFKEAFHPVPNVEPTHVFEVLTPRSMEDTLASVLERINIDDIDQRQIVDIFAAQLFINTLLRAHVGELTMRAAQAQHEAARMKLQSDVTPNDDYNLKELKQKIKEYQRQNERVRSFIGRIIDVSPETPTLQLVKDVIRATVAASRDEEESEESTISNSQEIERLQLENNKLCDRLNVEQRHRKKLMKALKVAENSIVTLSEQNKSIKMEKEDLTKESEKRISELQMQLSAKEGVTSDLSGQMEILKENHRMEMAESTRKLSAAESKIASLLKQVDETALIIARIKKQRRTLGKQIEHLQQANQMLNGALESQSTRSKRQHAEDLQRVQQQCTKAFSDLERATAKSAQLEEKITSLSQEITSLQIAKKSAEIKLKSVEERFAVERQSFETQSAVRAQAAQAETSAALSTYKKQIEDATNRLGSLLASDYVHLNLDSALSAIEREIGLLRQTQDLYVTQSSELTAVQRALGSNDDILGAVEKLKDSLITLQNRKVTPITDQSAQKELESLRREAKRAESAVNQLRAWEQWGRQAVHVVRERETTTMSASEVRQSLEEVLLASVAHRSIFYRLEALRDEKSILMRIDKKLLSPGRNYKNSLRGLMIVVLGLRRMQRQAGCLPIASLNPDLIVPTKYSLRGDKI